MQNLSKELDKKINHAVSNCSTNDEIANAVFLLCREYYLEKEFASIPTAYIAGQWFFNGLRFNIDENVLVPRLDTEVLVNVATRHIEGMIKEQIKPIRVLDLCTGSSCVAVSIAKHRPEAKVTAIDICKKALIIAKRNSKKHRANVKFIKSDLFNSFKKHQTFDLIVSNPPYIESRLLGKDDFLTLEEPNIALDGGEDGLEFYRKIASDSKEYLVNNGVLILEIGYKQSNSVQNILLKQGFCDINIVKDTQGKNRVVTCKFKG